MEVDPSWITISSSPQPAVLAKKEEEEEAGDTSGGGRKRYACDECSYRARLPHHLKGHKLSHHSQIWLACGQCDYQVKVTTSHSGAGHNCKVSPYPSLF